MQQVHPGEVRALWDAVELMDIGWNFKENI
jgi:hypothetical protein